MIRPVSPSKPTCSFRQDRRVLVPCLSCNHSPAPQSFRPVLSTSRCMGSPSLRVRGRGTSSVSARRLSVAWSGTARVSPSRWMMEPISPSVWRSARRNTALSVRAVKIARGEYQRCPPRVVRGSAFQATTASSANQTVRLPRFRRAASYAAEFVLLLRNVVAVVLVQLERQGASRGSEKGRLSYVVPARRASAGRHGWPDDAYRAVGPRGGKP